MGAAEASVRVLTPMAIHWCMSFVLKSIVENVRLHVDAAFLTTWAAVFTLPILWKLFRQDERMRRVADGMGVMFPRRTSPRPAFGWKDGLRICVLALICNLVLTIPVNLIAEALQLNNAVQEGLFAGNLFFQIVGVAVIVPIMEEVLFRGLVYERLKDYNKEWLSALIAAALFAVYHENAIQILFAFPMGCILIAVYRRWGTLRAPVIFHITVNLSSVLMTAWR